MVDNLFGAMLLNTNFGHDDRLFIDDGLILGLSFLILLVWPNALSNGQVFFILRNTIFHILCFVGHEF